MISVYNFLLTFFSLLLLPLIILVVISRSKYRGRSLERLGLKTAGIRSKLSAPNSAGPVLWIHALSVGEVTSALPLVKAIRTDMAGAKIVFTAATHSGRQIADTLVGPYVDCIYYSPFDLRFAVRRYITAISPDLFILEETDFWPNWLNQLKAHNIQTMLVNGRISAKSFRAYNRFSFFFKPMFRCFSLIAMQKTADADKMIQFGIEQPDTAIVTLGNLKYDIDTTDPPAPPLAPTTLGIDADKEIWVCGSTHPGEEEILFAAFKELNSRGNLYLILAPRDISRGNELAKLARKYGLIPRTRSSGASGGNVLILDTIGELASCYSLARLSFIGGSLVAQGGHNPIEPAAHGVPVLFGCHMEDFAEIADDLVACGGAVTVSPETLITVAAGIVNSAKVHAVMAEAASALVVQHRGGLARHLQALHQLLQR